ncbi:MAG: hypothetical protein ABH851_03870 [Methanobacteriota archaeon]
MKKKMKTRSKRSQGEDTKEVTQKESFALILLKLLSSAEKPLKSIDVLARIPDAEMNQTCVTLNRLRKYGMIRAIPKKDRIGITPSRPILYEITDYGVRKLREWQQNLED